jgi:hypothetical protein
VNNQKNIIIANESSKEKWIKSVPFCNLKGNAGEERKAHSPDEDV